MEKYGFDYKRDPGQPQQLIQWLLASVAQCPSHNAYTHYRDAVAAAFDSTISWVSVSFAIFYGIVTLGNCRHGNSYLLFRSRRGDDFTPRQHCRCPEGSVRSC